MPSRMLSRWGASRKRAGHLLYASLLEGVVVGHGAHIHGYVVAERFGELAQGVAIVALCEVCLALLS